MNKGILNSETMVAMVPAYINSATNNSTSYIIGSVIALLIMGYLIYSLLRPDKF